MRQEKSDFKSFQDFEPVVLRKSKTTNSHSTHKSNTNIHINNKNNLRRRCFKLIEIQSQFIQLLFDEFKF